MLTVHKGKPPYGLASGLDCPTRQARQPTSTGFVDRRRHQRNLTECTALHSDQFLLFDQFQHRQERHDHLNSGLLLAQQFDERDRCRRVTRRRILPFALQRRRLM